MQTTSTTSIFSVVATPIGNLEDITLRAIRILKEADLVLCEDTRVTRNLFDKYGITTRTMSYHAKSASSKVDAILALIAEGIAGENGIQIALVSDAGTPGISDPGSLLVSHIRARFQKEIESGVLKIEAIPGPSALIAALSVAGVPCADFTFLGFLPHKKGRETLFKKIASVYMENSTDADTASDRPLEKAFSRTIVFYESPHRIEKTLESLDGALAQTEGVTVVIGRELTKIFEEIVRGTPADISAFFKHNPEKIRGEFTVIIARIKSAPVEGAEDQEVLFS